MEKYELSAYDFTALNDALDFHIQKLSVVFEVAAAVKGVAAPDSETAAKRLNRARDLREKFTEAHAAWLEFE
jgi:hypothetical protein